MENPAPFDLEQQIQLWRQRFGGAPAMASDSVEELEAHLRDGIAVLESRGLSTEEAFIIASRRLGSRTDLLPEYKKINPGPLWASRLAWMIAGIYLFLFIRTWAELASGITSLLTLQLPNNSQMVAWLRLIAYWGCFAAILGTIWRNFSKRQNFAALQLRISKSPRSCCAALIFVYLLTWTLTQATSSLLAKYVGLREYAIASQSYLLLDLFGVRLAGTAGLSIALIYTFARLRPAANAKPKFE